MITITDRFGDKFYLCKSGKSFDIGYQSTRAHMQSGLCFGTVRVWRRSKTVRASSGVGASKSQWEIRFGCHSFTGKNRLILKKWLAA
jgi:hypothetical protein